MSFRIRPVYKEKSNASRLELLEQPTEEVEVEDGDVDTTENDNNELAAKLSGLQQLLTAQKMMSGQTSSLQNLSNLQTTLEQKKAAIMNQRSQVKPSAKNSIRQTTFEGGFESDMY